MQTDAELIMGELSSDDTHTIAAKRYLNISEQTALHIPAHRDHPFRLNVTACSG